MDSIEIIILIAFILFSLLGRSKKKKKRPAPQPAGDKKKQPSFFEEILRELEDKAQQATKPTPVPVEANPEESGYATQPAPREDPFAQEEAFTRAGQGHTPHEEHGFGPDSPFSEEAFERLPLDPPPPLHEAGHLVDTPHVSLGKPLSRPDAGTSSAAARRWRKRLQNPESARDAIVLKEIFDGPRTLS